LAWTIAFECATTASTKVTNDRISRIAEALSFYIASTITPVGQQSPFIAIEKRNGLGDAKNGE
jgi:hypothetical protein